MVLERCAFRTRRLLVEDWHRARDDTALATTVSAMLTPSVTEALPPAWHGPYSLDRAAQWIIERDAEATTLLVIEREADVAVGLLLLFEEASTDADTVEIRLGYLLAEQAWGRGLGGELVGGFVDWVQGQPTVRAVVAGVASGNLASIRILEGHGFRQMTPVGSPAEELEFRRSFER